MAKLDVLKGKTSKLAQVFIQDTTSASGAGLTGLVFNSAGLTGYYYREGAASATAITLATMTVGTWATGGFKEIDATNMPGWYQMGIPDAALASGADSVGIHLKGAANMAMLPLEIQLQNFDPYDGVRGGLTTLPNAAAEAAGGLFTRGTGAGQINQAANGMVDTNTVRLNNVSQSLLDLKDFADDGYDPSTDKVTGVLLTDTVTTYTGNTKQTGDNYVRLGAPVGASISADVAGVQADTDNIQTRLPAALTGGRMDSSVGAMAADVVTASALAASAGTEIAEAILKLDVSTVTGEASSSVLNALRFLRNKWTLVGATLTVYKEDGSTTAWTETVATTVGANPVTSTSG